MNKYEIKTQTVEDTTKLGVRLANLLKPSDVITLEGELGAGKTIFAKGMAKGLGVEQPVTSPTFTIIKEYEGELPFYHMDAYRLEFSEEDIGFSEYFNGNGISVVEWAQFIQEFLPMERLDITIQHIDEQSRLITFHPTGKHYERIMKQMFG